MAKETDRAATAFGGFQLLDHLPICAFVIGPDLKVVFWNSALEGWSGVGRDEIVGTDISERFPRFKDPCCAELLKRIFSGGPAEEFSFAVCKNVIPPADERARPERTTVSALFGTGVPTPLGGRAAPDVPGGSVPYAFFTIRHDAERIKPDGVHGNADVDARGVSELSRLESEFISNDRFLMTILRSIRDPFSIIDRKYTIVWANEAYAKMRDMVLEDLLGRKCYEVLQGREERCEDCVVNKTFSTASPCAKEKRFVFPDKLNGWVEIYTHPIFDEDGGVSHVIEYSRDITERKSSENEHLQLIEVLEHLSKTDSLTGMLNRRALVEVLTIESERAKRHGSELSMIFCDIDFLKEINDRHGHDMGDRALRLISGEINSLLRSSDSVGRYGGDEFIVLMPDTQVRGA